VAASIYKRLGNLDDGIDRWISSSRITEDEQSAEDVKVVRYEDLITDTESVLREICRFLGLTFIPAMLDYHKTERMWFGGHKGEQTDGRDGEAHVALRNWQINQPIFDGRGKWKSVLEGTPPRLASGEGGDLMEHFGYPVSDS
jgi:hypothetical protein